MVASDAVDSLYFDLNWAGLILVNQDAMDARSIGLSMLCSRYLMTAQRADGERQQRRGLGTGLGVPVQRARTSKDSSVDTKWRRP